MRTYLFFSSSGSRTRSAKNCSNWVQLHPKWREEWKECRNVWRRGFIYCCQNKRHAKLILISTWKLWYMLRWQAFPEGSAGAEVVGWLCLRIGTNTDRKGGRKRQASFRISLSSWQGTTRIYQQSCKQTETRNYWSPSWSNVVIAMHSKEFLANTAVTVLVSSK